MQEKLLELWLLINADRKKSVVLGASMLVLVVLGGRQLLSASPRAANAQQATVLEQLRDQAVGDLDAQLLFPDAGAIRVPTPDVERPRDLFRFSDRYFPPPKTESPVVANAAKLNEGNDESTDAHIDEDAQRVARVRSEAERFRLRSTILGATPIATIEIVGERATRSEMLRPGEQISGFTLVDVGSHSVTLRKSGVEITLQRRLD